jgi:trigger factor
MSYKIERDAPCRVVLTSTFDTSGVSAERERVVADWVRQARLPGFRRGKAPRPIVERHFVKEIREDLEEHLIRAAWQEVRDKEKLHLASSLGVREATWLDDGGFLLKGEFEVYPEVTFPAVDDFTPPPFALEPGDAEVDEALKQLQERQATWAPVEGGAAQPGMLVEAEVHGEFPDGGGEPFGEERSLFVLGNNEVYPEIEAAVTGKVPGDKATAERVIGEEGGEQRQGKRIAYRLTLKSLRQKLLPEVDDSFAASLGAEHGVSELRTRVLERVRVEKTRQRRETWRAALVGYLRGAKPLDLPESVVKEETGKELAEFAQALAARGVNPDKSEVDWSKLEQEMRQRVTARLEAELVLDALADALGVTISEQDVDDEVAAQAKRLGVPFGELRGNLAKRGGLDRVGAIVRRERAVDEVLRRHGERT